MLLAAAFRRALVFVFVAAVVVGSRAIAAEPGNADLVLVLDASGSMWGKVRGEPKIAVARRVLKDLLGKVPAGTAVGLVAYGHRSKEDCTDIETIAEPGALDRAALAKRIDALDAKGKTPISATVQKVIEELRQRERPATVVLVSDGIESCGGDACAIVRAARESGVKLVLHVVGFDVGKVDVAQLECVAQAGGGLYLPADDAAQLAAALTQAVAMTPETPAGRLSIAARADGKLADAIVTVTRAGSKEPVTQLRTYETAETNPRVLSLPDGTYDVVVQAVKIKGAPRREIEGLAVAGGETVERAVEFGTGVLRVGVTRNGKPSDATVTVREAGTSQVVASGRTYAKAESNPKEMRLPAGRYDVAIASVEIAGAPGFAWEGVEVGGAEPAARSHDFATGTIAVGARRGADLVDALVEVVPQGGSKAIATGRTYASAQSNPKSFEVPAGPYVVRVKPVKGPAASAQEIAVDVAAGARVERTIELAPQG